MRAQLFHRVDEARAVHRAVRGIFGFVLVLVAVPALFDLQAAHRGGGCFDRHHGLRKVRIGDSGKIDSAVLDKPTGLELGLLELFGPEIGKGFTDELAGIKPAGDLGRERRLTPQVRVGLLVGAPRGVLDPSR